MRAFFARLLALIFGNPGTVRQTVSGGATAAFLAAATPFIGGWEGLRLTAYQDIVGVWTVCYGETRGVQPGDTHTRAECDAMLEREILAFREELGGCLTDLDELPVPMQVAFTSWAYNVGTGAACRSTLVRKANADDLAGACAELPRWNRAGGRVVRGLTNRRIAERDLCRAGLAA
jgi:lysozyme